MEHAKWRNYAARVLVFVGIALGGILAIAISELLRKNHVIPVIWHALGLAILSSTVYAASLYSARTQWGKYLHVPLLFVSVLLTFGFGQVLLSQLNGSTWVDAVISLGLVLIPFLMLFFVWHYYRSVASLFGLLVLFSCYYVSFMIEFGPVIFAFAASYWLLYNYLLLAIIYLVESYFVEKYSWSLAFLLRYVGATAIETLFFLIIFFMPMNLYVSILLSWLANGALVIYGVRQRDDALTISGCIGAFVSCAYAVYVVLSWIGYDTKVVLGSEGVPLVYSLWGVIFVMLALIAAVLVKKNHAWRVSHGKGHGAENYGTMVALIVIGTSMASFYYYRTTLTSDVPTTRAQLPQTVAPFFAEVKKQLADATHQVERLTQVVNIIKDVVPEESKESLASSPSLLTAEEAKLKFLRIIDIIVRRDIEQLKNTPVEALQRDIDITVGGEHFQDVPTDQGTIVAAQLAGKNALAMVLFHSALDQTQQDRDATLAMLQVLFDKKLDPQGREQAGIVYFIQPPGEQYSRDYVGMFSLAEIAAQFSFKEAANKLREYQKAFKE